MLSKPWDNPPACSNCGSTRVAWVLQGMPNFGDPGLRRLLDEGRILLGGCCFGNCWVCHDCAERERNLHGDHESHNRVYGPSGWNSYAGGFDPQESDAAREARWRAECAEWEQRQAKKAAYRATPRGAYEHLKSLVAAAEQDIGKAEGGNKAAGIRARRAMLDARAAAQAVRNSIQCRHHPDRERSRKSRHETADTDA